MPIIDSPPRARCLLLLLLAAWLLPLSLASAEVFKYRDARGQILLTDKPMRGMTLLKRYDFGSGGLKSRSAVSALAAMHARRQHLEPLITQAAERHSLRPALVHAVIRAESAYQADAVSSKGAVGLMQLMPATAERYGVTDRNDPAQNLAGGTAYLRDLLTLFEDDLELALAAYNAGENAVIRHGHRIPPYRETQDYVRKVLRFLADAGGADQLAAR